MASAGKVKKVERPDAIRLLVWLSDSDNVRALAESWFWKRWRDTSRSVDRARLSLLAAVYNIETHRATGEGLRWPGDVGRGPDPDSQVVILAAAWLRGIVDLPGLDAPTEHWSDDAVAALAGELAGTSSLPWYAIDTRDKCRGKLKLATAGQYGGAIEVVMPPPDWSIRVTTLIA